MRIVVAREPDARVALMPADVPRLLALGHEVLIEADLSDLHPDAAYVAAGARLGTRGDADLVVSVQPVGARGTSLALRDATYSLERVPRTGRAQPADAVTSQSLVAGHHGALLAASAWDGLLGRHTTAAGTLGPAEALVLGTGVAGLEAIATLGRLGVRVTAHDVRPSAPAEVASLGATYVETPDVTTADLLVTTARVVGQSPPVLVTRAQREAMRPGAVVVDVAGGNVEGPVLWRGGPDAAAARPGPASQLYSANVTAFLGFLTRDPDDEIVRACAS